MIRRNKRGDIPVMILVLGVFAICALVIVSLVGVENKKNEYSSGFPEMVEMNSQIAKYNFYQEIGMPESKIDELLKVKIDNGRRYFSIEGKGFVVKYYL